MHVHSVSALQSFTPPAAAKPVDRPNDGDADDAAAPKAALPSGVGAQVDVTA